MSTEVTVKELPNCDFCMFGAPHKAIYDFKSKQGPWGYGCEKAYKAHRAFKDLGTGKGQRLVVQP